MADNLTFCGRLGKKALTFQALFVFLCAFLIPFAPGFAKEALKVSNLQSVQAKAKTVSAIKAMKKDRWSEARDLVAQSKDPLASKIFYWMSLMNMQKADWTDNNFIRLSHFIRENQDWPGINKMTLAAEGLMPQTLSNDEVIAWYDDFPPVTAFGMDRYMGALIINGKRDQAKKFMTDWWAKTVLPREQQRDIYKKYSSYITADAHKKRLDLLLLGEGYDSARAIAGVLGNGYPELAEARIGLKRDAPNVSALVNKVPRALQNDAGLLYERLHWRRVKNLNTEAIQILDNQPASAKIQNLDAWWKERHIIIRRLMEQGQYSRAYHLASKHGQIDGAPYAEAEWLAGWLALRFLKKTGDAYARFSKLYDKVETPLSKSRAAYWSGRAAMAMGQKDQSLEWYRKGAKFQTFYYGQLSASALFMQSELPKEKGYAPSVGEKDKFSRDELIQAYNLFYEAGFSSEAGRFMQAFLDVHDLPQAYHYAAEKASSRGDYYDAVKIAKDAARKGMFLTKQSYPTVTDWLRTIRNVEWALVHALIRQESMFDTQAQSSAGAMGLMQLMPGTAKEVAGKLGITYDKAGLKSRPDYNIRLGTSYMSRLLSRYQGSYPMAIAAYNAGPGRVDEWIRVFGDPRQGEIDYLDWIELIPIYETRNYVQRVMEGVYVYRLRLKGVQVAPNVPIHIAYRTEP